jgi:hypothetical protein
MTAIPHDEMLSMYATYLEERGYKAVKIPETTTRTPDLEVSGHEHSYLNELKAPDFLVDPTLGLYKFTTTNSKLLQFIHTALKQFQSYDPSHARPWVITFASTNFQLHWRTLFDAMQGGSLAEGKTLADWTRTTVFTRWTEDRYVADLYIWLQVNETQPYQASYLTNDLSLHRPLIDAFVADLRGTPLSSADNNWLLV